MHTNGEYKYRLKFKNVASAQTASVLWYTNIDIKDTNTDTQKLQIQIKNNSQTLPQLRNVKGALILTKIYSTNLASRLDQDKLSSDNHTLN